MGRGLALAALAALVLTASPTAAVTPLDRDLLREINSVRAAHGRAPLRLDPVLQRAAEAHSGDMVAHDYFAHGDFAARMRRFGARGPLLGENLAWGAGAYAAAPAIVRLWLGSPGHRANLLRASFQRVGVAAVTGRFGGVAGAVVVTVDFAGDPGLRSPDEPTSGASTGRCRRTRSKASACWTSASLTASPRTPFEMKRYAARPSWSGAMRRPRSHPYLFRYGRSLRPCLARRPAQPRDEPSFRKGF